MKVKKNNQSNIKSIGYLIRDELPKEAIKAFDNLVKKDRTIDYQKLDKDFGGNKYDFTMFSTMGKLLKRLYYGKILVPDAEREQDKFYFRLKKLKEYQPLTINAISKKKNFLRKTYKAFIMEEKW